MVFLIYHYLLGRFKITSVNSGNVISIQLYIVKKIILSTKYLELFSKYNSNYTFNADGNIILYQIKHKILLYQMIIIILFDLHFNNDGDIYSISYK